MKKMKFVSSIIFLTNASLASAQPIISVAFSKMQLTDKFWTEAPVIGDLNKDGKPDVIIGPYWYEGPSFKSRHEYRPAIESFSRPSKDGIVREIEGYGTALGAEASTGLDADLFTKIVDLNNDGWPDILTAGPGSGPKQLVWYENPGKRQFNKGSYWRRHAVAENVDNQSVEWVDLFGNGKPVLIAMSGGLEGRHGGKAGYFQPDPANPEKPWTFHPISWETDEFQWYTHGIGAGDINGDGRKDILHSDGWWEQPASLVNDPVWTYHPYPFNIGPGQIKQYLYAGPTNPLRVTAIYDLSADGVPAPLSVHGGSVMHVDDVNGDGLADVICSITAHAYGLAWWEQFRDAKGNIKFKRNLIINRKGDNKYGVSFTGMQAVEWADVDGDGLKDIVTGKRFWIHGDRDPEATHPAVLYWVRQTHTADGKVEFIPYQIDDNSGAGNHIAIGDVNGDRKMDIVTANKKGAFIFLQK